MIEGDSSEYEILTEAVTLAANTAGLCAEIGVRRGMGTKYIIDAVADQCAQKVVIGIDPWGSIPYIGREQDGECRLYYDNSMRMQCLIDLAEYANQRGVNWIPFVMTDSYFFQTMANGVEINDIMTRYENRYCMVHLDGPHTVAALTKEIMWFNERMDSGATIVIDDITIDFVDIAPINTLLVKLGWDILKQGFKKGLYQKI